VQDHPDHPADKDLLKAAQLRRRLRKPLNAREPLVTERDRILDAAVEDLRLGRIRGAFFGQ
jgi:hypothetical protein